jgi:hypothetical protein
MGDAALDALLRRQAETHGLARFTPLAADKAEPALASAVAEDVALLPLFAGMRAPQRVADSYDSEGFLSPLAESVCDVAQLEALGLAPLKAELQRVGAKCGGTLKERAARLWRLRGRTRLHVEDADLLPKAEGTLPSAQGAKRKGPLLPGQRHVKAPCAPAGS